jgi:hypothetical protein
MRILSLVIFLLSIQYPAFLQNTTLLRSVTHAIPPYTDYWTYDANNRPASIITTTKDSTTVLMFYTFKRDKDQQLVATEVRDVSYAVIYSFQYYYNSAKQVTKIEKWADMDYDGQADDVDHTFSIGYDSLGRVSTLLIRKQYAVARDFVFHWQEGNIVLVENTDGEINYHMSLGFDLSSNILEPIKWEYITTTGTLEFYVAMFCKNNLIKATLFPAAMDSAELNLHPEYYEDGLFRTNHVEGVEYDYISK